MFYVKKLLSALVLPPMGPVFLALFGLWLGRRHPRLGRGIAFCALATLVALSLAPVADALQRSLGDYPPLSAERLRRAQAIVILGGGTYFGAPEYGADTVSRLSLERVRYGAWLQKRSGLPMLVAGGAPLGGRPEAEAMKEVVEREFGGTVKWVENASRDTNENAAYSARMLAAAGISRIALVTHGSHMARAAGSFARQGLEVIPAPTGFATHSPSAFARALPSSEELRKSSEALREWLGIAAGRVLD